MAIGGLGGLGGYDFGSMLGALGGALLSSPREAPFQNLPQLMELRNRQAEQDASKQALALVAQKLGIDPRLANNSTALSFMIEAANKAKSSAELQDVLKNAPSVLMPSSGGGGLGGLGGLPGAPANPANSAIPAIPGSAGAAAQPLTGLAAAASRGKGLPSMRGAAKLSDEDKQAIAASAQRLGVSPVDWATVIGFESAGSYSPAKYGGSGGRHLGLIQFGPTEQKQFGARPDQTVAEQLQSAEKFLLSRGFKPGQHGLNELYATINAGSPNKLNARDAAAGGTPGTVLDKIRYQMGPHRRVAEAMFGNLQPQVAQAAPDEVSDAPGRSVDLASLGNGTTVPVPPSRPVNLGMGPQPAAPVAAAAAVPDTDAAGLPTAPYEVAASGRSVPVPTPPMPAPPPPPAAPAKGAENQTKARAGQMFDYYSKLAAQAAASGNAGVHELAKQRAQIAAKYLEPDQLALRIEQAGLSGTPLGNALLVGAPANVQEALSERQIPGYEAPATRERQRMGLEERKFTNTQNQQELARFQNERDARLRQEQFEQSKKQGRPEATRLGESLGPASPDREATERGLTAQATEAGLRTKAAEIGKEQGAAQTSLPKVEANVQNALSLINSVRSHPGRQFGTGLTGVLPAAPGSQVADFRAKLDQLTGQTFLSAFETLKGGGQITEVEGKKATEAIGNLKTTQSREQFAQALDDLAGVIIKGQDTARAKAGLAPANSFSAAEITQSLQKAREAITRGASRDAVVEHLMKNGIDPRGLGF